MTEVEEENIGIVLHSEVWEKRNKKKHQRKIEELFEMHGMFYCSTPRPKRRGGGSEITCNAEEFNMKEIKMENPDNLEVTFALIKPKAEGAKNLSIIAVALYCPPRSKKQMKLLNFVAESYQLLKMKYPSAFFMLGGDVNELNWTHIEKISPSFSQCVKKPTRGGKILSILITDLHPHYDEVRILPSLEPDVPGVG